MATQRYNIKVYYIQTPEENDYSEENLNRKEHLLQFVLWSLINNENKKSERRFYDLKMDVEMRFENVDEALDYIFTNCQNIDEDSNMLGEARSMMVGDIIEVNGDKFSVDHIGFSEIEWYKEEN